MAKHLHLIRVMRNIYAKPESLGTRHVALFGLRMKSSLKARVNPRAPSDIDWC